MMEGERNRQRFTSGLLEPGGPPRPMVPISAHPPRHRQSGGIQHRRQGSRDRSDRNVALSDVVKESSLDRFAIISEGRLNTSSDADGVILVGAVLTPEQRRAGVVQMIVNELLVLGAGRSSPDVAEESFDQVLRGTQSAIHDEDLHLTQSRDVGR